MFGAKLNHQERRALLNLLAKIAESDRNVSDAERTFIAREGQRLNASTEDLFTETDQMTLEQICGDFQSDPARRYAMTKAIELGFIDNAYVEDEWVDVRRIARLLDIPDREVSTFEDWVKEGRRWKKRGRELINPDSA